MHLLRVPSRVQAQRVAAGVADDPASAFDVVGRVVVVAMDLNLRLLQQLRQVGDERTGERVALKPGMHRPL